MLDWITEQGYNKYVQVKQYLPFMKKISIVMLSLTVL